MCRYLCISSWCTFYITFRYDSYDYIAIYSLVGGILILQKQNLFNGISLQLEMFLFKSFSCSECVACHVQEQADELASREVAQSMGLATPTLPWSDSCSKQCQRGRFIDSTNRNVMAAWGLLNKNYKNTKQKGKLGLILSMHMSVHIIVYPISNYLRKEPGGRGPSAGVGNWQLELMPTHWKQLSSCSNTNANVHIFR